MPKTFQVPDTFSLLRTIDEEKANYRYAPNKWNMKHVLGHITDHEGIKMQRAFLLSRKQLVELLGPCSSINIAAASFPNRNPIPLAIFNCKNIGNWPRYKARFNLFFQNLDSQRSAGRRILTFLRK